MNKYKKRYQKVNNINNNNNKNKKLSGLDDGINKKQNSNYILRSSTYTWQNYCKNSSWIYYLVNSTTLITNILFILLLSINGLSCKLVIEGSLPAFVKSYDWFFSSIKETTKDLVAFYYHPTTIYQMIIIIMGFIFSYIWDFFKVWLDLITHGIVVVILLYKPFWKKKIIFFYLFHVLCYYFTGDVWGFKLIDYVFSWRYTLINFCENILAGSDNSDKDFLQWFKNNSESQKQREIINSYKSNSANHLSISPDDNGTSLDFDTNNNILFSFISELINRYSRKFCVVGPVSWVWIWILGLKIWYSSWIIENIKDIYVRFRESIEKNIVLNIIHWNYLESDDSNIKSAFSPSSSPRNTQLPPLSKYIYHPSSDFDAAKSYILNNNKIAKSHRKPQQSVKSGLVVKSKDLHVPPIEIKNSDKNFHSSHPSTHHKTHKKVNSYSSHITPTISTRTIRIRKS
ncbi:hypothetical protein BCR36DRAFT_403581 [Piromyces finnis]|uniref:Uncharacterized protein n=1 Tax=Piromyces finnis TaxID=1754191 RepID=A0A1Y1VE27_9FUNG|nr:hypothetical protein BCR36DRAFT_403581 [Piromyces finnis]|eukprot:ORX53354.1 hypothetical protein BCR36DRAFT_403581 [Piromyces finnis]